MSFTLIKWRTVANEYVRLSAEAAALRRGEMPAEFSFSLPLPHVASPAVISGGSPGPAHESSPGSDHSMDGGEPKVYSPKLAKLENLPRIERMGSSLAPLLSSELELLKEQENRERERREQVQSTLAQNQRVNPIGGGYAREFESAPNGLGPASFRIRTSMERGQSSSTEYRPYDGLLARGEEGTVGSPLAIGRNGSSVSSYPHPSRPSPRLLQQPRLENSAASPSQDPYLNEDISFDFDSPFDFSFADSVPLPPLFQDLFDTSATRTASPSTTSNPRPLMSLKQEEEEDLDLCPTDDFTDPPPLPNGRIPCDKPECDFSIINCALPIPWRPRAVEGGKSDKDTWICKVAWAKLCSHPMFSGCDVDELCHELRDKTRCSDDGRLVIEKSDVCALFRQIPARARTRRERIEMEGGRM